MKDMNKCAAEFVGTFYLCFAGIGSIIAVTMNGWEGSAGGLLAIALAHGLALSIGVAVTGGISGGHLNPAVTTGMLVTKRICPVLAGKYILSQLAGATLAALVCYRMYAFSETTVATGIPLPPDGVTDAMSIMIPEFVMTFLLVTSVYSVAVDPRGKGVKIGAFAIGLTVTFCILAGGPVTGASMNPARSFGPAVVTQMFDWHWCYWVAPLLGGAAAGMFYHHCLLCGTDEGDCGGDDSDGGDDAEGGEE